MAEFNYTEYIKNNPLLQEEVKDKLLTESQEVNEESPSSKITVSELKAEIKEIILSSLAEEEKPDGMDIFFGADAKDKVKKRREDAVDFLQKHKEKYGLKEDDVEEGFADKIVKGIAGALTALGIGRTQIDSLGDILNLLPDDAAQQVSDIIQTAVDGGMLGEADEDEVDIEDEIEADAEPAMEPEMDAAPEVGLSKDEQEIQNSLKLAYDNAVAIGDDKLADQIGNSITFFTRTHVVER